ncbi:hypothetical protein DRO02_01700 [archaeon]|nr:MAG: hypothetical protein DRN89_02035 [archaeon]RLG65545.1 MAG: hypothetical protein DRO02_01700 [archaeon]RLG65686.1 MAG: hypothetical protein DRO21_01285 [archaeon]HDM23571.1 hypothetical protein [Candidatus Bathyarchaeota archaeon]
MNVKNIAAIVMRKIKGLRQISRKEIKEKIKEIPYWISEASLPINRDSLLTLIILLMICSIAALIRLQPLEWGAFLGAYDPHVQYMATKYLIEKGLGAYFHWHNQMAWYPYGQDMWKALYLGVPFTTAILYMIVKLFIPELSIYTFCVYIPVFFGCLTVLAAFFLGKEVANRNVGLLTAFLLAILPAYVSRTTLGFYDNEFLGVFLLTMIFLFMVKGVKPENADKSLRYGIITGLLLAYLAASWGAFLFAFNLLALSILTLIVFKRYQPFLTVYYTSAILIGCALAALVPRTGPQLLLSANLLIPYFTLILLWIIELTRHLPIPFSLQIRTVIIGIIVISLGLGALYLIGLIFGLPSKFWAVINPFFRTQIPLIMSVGEHHPSPWAVFYAQQGMAFLFAPIGTILLMKRRRNEDLVAIVYGLLALYFASSMVRLLLILAPAVAFLAAYGFYSIATPIIDAFRAKPAIISPRRMRVTPIIEKEFLSLFLASLIAISMLTTFYMPNFVDQARYPVTIASSAISARGYYNDWLEVLMWLRMNVPPGTVVASWWDYGYWLQSMGEKTTLVDNATSNSTQIHMVAKAFMSTEEEALKIFKRYNVSYVVVFITVIRDRQGKWRFLMFGDYGKLRWICEIAGYKWEDYWDSTKSMPKEPLYNTTIFKLLMDQYKDAVRDVYQGQVQVYPLQLFKLVYKSEHGWVLVYQPLYNKLYE